MTRLDRDSVGRQILEAIGEVALQQVRPLIGSETLRNALTLLIDESELRAQLFIPHYWAVYYHDGTAGSKAKAGKYLVFFDNPDDDPRGNPSPVRLSARRILTKAEFDDGLEKNRARREAGVRPFMFVVRQTGPAPAHPFFEKGLSNLSSSFRDLVVGIFDDAVQQAIDEDEFPTDEGGPTISLGGR